MKITTYIGCLLLAFVVGVATTEFLRAALPEPTSLIVTGVLAGIALVIGFPLALTR